MPALQVRDFPQPLYEQLKERAEKDHRSIAQEVVFIVEDFLSSPQKHSSAVQPPSIYAPRIEPEGVIQERIERKRKLFEEIAANPLIIPDDFPSPEEIIRAIRDDREEELDARIAAFAKGAGE